MGLYRRLKAAVLNNSVTSGPLESILRSLGVGRLTDAGISVSEETAIACSTVFSCVRVLAETVSTLPLPVYRQLPSGDREQAREHPLWDLLNNRPNSWQTAMEFREMLMGHLVLRGNAYAYIVRNILSGEIISLIPLRPGSVRPIQREDLTLEYEYTNKWGQTKTYQQSEMMHLRGISFDGVEGVTPLKAYRNSVGLAMAAEKLHAKSFANGVKHTGLIKAKGDMTPEALKNLRESIEGMHSGDNAFKTPVLEEGLDWVSTSMPLVDAQLLETRKFQKSEICSIYRVPPRMAGVTEAAKGWSTLEMETTEFITFSLLPWFKRWEQVIRRDLMSPADRKSLTVEHNVAGLLRGDTPQRFDAYNKGILGGWLNRNEVRAMENRNRVDGLDEYLQPMNMTNPDKEKTDGTASQ